MSPMIKTTVRGTARLWQTKVLRNESPEDDRRGRLLSPRQTSTHVYCSFVHSFCSTLTWSQSTQFIGFYSIKDFLCTRPVCVLVCVCVCVCARKSIYLHCCIFVLVCMWVCVCLSVYMCVCVCVYPLKPSGFITNASFDQFGHLVVDKKITSK